MAELLIVNRKHWMDDLNEKQLAEYVEKYPKFMSKYDARTQKGDVVEVKDDGHWTGEGRGYDKSNFDVVIVKDKTVAELSYLQGPLTEDKYTLEFDEITMTHKTVNNPVVVKKFKANISTYTDKAEVALEAVLIKEKEL